MRKISFIAVIIIVLASMVSCKKNNSGDTTAPVITIIGSPQVYVDKGTSYTEEGATAYDETDGDITSKIVIVNPVDANTEGTYYVSYNVTDEAGNKATEIKRKVVVMVF